MIIPISLYFIQFSEYTLRPVTKVLTSILVQQMLLEHSNCIPLMKQAYNILCEECVIGENGNNNPNLAMHLQFEYSRQTRFYNLLQIDEITLILLGDGNILNATCHIVIHLRGGMLHCISKC